jgi:hypothetical protein
MGREFVRPPLRMRGEGVAGGPGGSRCWARGARANWGEGGVFNDLVLGGEASVVLALVSRQVHFFDTAPTRCPRESGSARSSLAGRACRCSAVERAISFSARPIAYEDILIKVLPDEMHEIVAIN